MRSIFPVLIGMIILNITILFFFPLYDIRMLLVLNVIVSLLGGILSIKIMGKEKEEKYVEESKIVGSSSPSLIPGANYLGCRNCGATFSENQVVTITWLGSERSEVVLVCPYCKNELSKPMKARTTIQAPIPPEIEVLSEEEVEEKIEEEATKEKIEKELKKEKGEESEQV